LLISPKAAAAPQLLSDKSLAGVEIGTPVGIPDAPDTVPLQSALLHGAWTRCLRPDLQGGQVIDFAPDGHTSPLPGNRQVLLSGPGDTAYVLWDGTKYKVGGEAALIALGMADQKAVPAPKGWLSALPDGPTLAAPKIPDAGRSAGEVAGQPARVGELFRTDAGGTGHFFVMLRDGVTPVSSTVAALLSAKDGAAEPRTVSAGAIAGATVSRQNGMGQNIPDLLNMRPLTTEGAAVCVRQQSGGRSPRTQAVLESGAAATGNRQVLIPPGGGVLAVDQTDADHQQTPPEEFLITEGGVEFPLSGDQTASALGYGNSGLLALPTDLIALLPKGPVLSMAVAAATVQAR
jgi:type VII secretion protein EccB